MIFCLIILNLQIPSHGKRGAKIVVGFIHVLGIAFLIMGAEGYPQLLGLGFLAYTLGLRHAFDVDHIAAIDNTVRKMVQEKKDASGIGFYFSLGHSSVVLLMTLATIVAMQTEWKWRETTATTWTDGMIPGSLPLGKDYLVQLRVLDEQGAWSQPMARYVSTGSTALKPIADFQIPAQETKFKTLDIKDQSYDPAGRNITQKVWTVSKDGAQVYTGSTMISDFKSYGAGHYTVSLKVLNDANLWSDEFQRITEVTEDLASPVISFSPKETAWTSEAIPMAVSFFDEGGINSKYYKVTSSKEVPGSWDTVQGNIQTVNLTDEGQWYIHAKASDLAGHETTTVAGPFQIQKLPQVPKLKLNSVGENWVEIGWSLPNSAFTDGYRYTIENVTTGKSWTVEYPTDKVREEELTAGTTYRYRIKTANRVGESAWSELFEVLTLPVAVGNLKVSFVPNNSSVVNVSFDEVTSADSYILTINKADKKVFDEEFMAAGTYQVTKLEPGKQYVASVTPKNVSGTGQSSMLGFLSLPAAPGEFKAAQIRESEVELTWNASETTSLYELLRNAQSRYIGPNLSFTDTGLESGTEYDYQLSAKNESGFGDISSLNGVLTLSGKTELVVEKIQKDEVSLSIKPVFGAERYVLLVNGVKEKELPAETEKFTMNSLDPGTNYIFEVYAENRSGIGVAGKASLSTLSDKPQRLTISEVEENKAKLSWDSVTGADKYKVSVSDAVYSEISGTVIVLTDLSPGTHYQPQITAGNVSGYGETAVGAFLTLPASPDNLHLVEVKSKQYTLAWDKVKSANKYVIYNNNGEQIGETLDTSYTVTNLKPGETSTVTAPSTSTGVGSGEQPSSDKGTQPGQNNEAGKNNPKKVSFQDIDNSFAHDEIIALFDKGIVKGISDTQFEPERKVTRAEFASMLVRALQLQENSNVSLTFEDIQRSAWYIPELSTAVLNGVAKGFNDKEFRPQNPINREQACKMLANGIYNGLLPGGAIHFKDTDAIAIWAKAEVTSLSLDKVITGYPDATFKPKRGLTRQESAALIYRSLKLINKQ